MANERDIRVEGSSGPSHPTGQTGSRSSSGRAGQGESNPQRKPNEDQNRSRNAEIGWYTPRDQWMNPLGVMREMARDMNRFFEGFGLSPLTSMNRGFEGVSPMRASMGMGAWPALELFDRDGRVMIRAELPGMRKEDVHVRMIDHQLIIEGERRCEQQQQEREGYYRSEFNYGRFSRVVTLPERVDPEQVSARFENGVLEITLDLPQLASREIPIEGGGETSFGGEEGRFGGGKEGGARERPTTGPTTNVREQPGGP